MNRYAKDTSVSGDRSRAEIENTLRRYGADSFAYMTSPGIAKIAFEAFGRRVRFEVPLPLADDPEFTTTPTGRARTDKQAFEELEKASRQRWRALALIVKAKLEAIASGIASFDQEFLPYILLPDGRTVAEHAVPSVLAAYEGRAMPPLLGKF
jgi:hypothetical protein